MNPKNQGSYIFSIRYLGLSFISLMVLLAEFLRASDLICLPSALMNNNERWSDTKKNSGFLFTSMIQSVNIHLPNQK